MSRLVWVLAALWIGPLAAMAQAPAVPGGNIDPRCLQPSETSCVDWANGFAIAVGSGAPAAFANTAAQKNLTARRAARIDASRNLLELIKGLNISSQTSMKQAMIENDQVASSIEGRLYGVRELGQPKFFSDGSIQVKVEARLYEIVPAELYAGKEGGAPRLLEAPGGPIGGSRIAPGTTYSGLVIDARGTGIVPAMSPKVYDPDGREVYGSAYVSRDFAIKQGMVGYVKSVEAAQTNDRVKGNPALIKAVKSQGANNADLVVSKEDADGLRAASQGQTFLREARVMIVLD
ncbi:MAG: hypothetical protein HY423_01500 [Candidatus Lambdaproteobacteria bacterium]|nr:hypothetical protein [Candidatus Lambdaproteobacteria bacterium]